MSLGLHYGPGTAALGFVALPAWPRSAATSSLSPMFMAKQRREPDEDVLESVANRVGNVLSQPTPGFPELYVGYPLALVSAALIFPLSTALLLGAFFTGYAFLGRQVTGKQDRSMVDFAALVAAVPSAGLLSPAGFAVNGGQGLVALLAIAGLGLAVVSFLEGSPSGDEKLLDEWDDKFDDDEYKDI